MIFYIHANSTIIMNISALLPPCTPMTILWYSLATFLLGLVIGWIIKEYIGHEKSNRLIDIIRLAVIILWVASTAKAIILNTDYPPLFLNIMFGAITGGLSPAIGDKALSFIQALKK